MIVAEPSFHSDVANALLLIAVVLCDFPDVTTPLDFKRVLNYTFDYACMGNDDFKHWLDGWIAEDPEQHNPKDFEVSIALKYTSGKYFTTLNAAVYDDPDLTVATFMGKFAKNHGTIVIRYQAPVDRTEEESDGEDTFHPASPIKYTQVKREQAKVSVYLSDIKLDIY